MNAEIVAIGSELADGQKLDTNSQWLSQQLEDLGIRTLFHTVVADDLEANVEVLRIAADRADLVIVGGGLGPTQDDLTREALARLAGVVLVLDERSLGDITAFFERRNRVMPERNRVQALLPEGAEALPNRVGTAPGIWMSVGPTRFACLPGVPHELRLMFDEQVVPRLKAAGRVERVIVHHVINMFGKGESEIEAQALDLTARGRVPEVGITASDAVISFRVSAAGADEAEARAAMEPTLELIRRRFGPWIVGEGDVGVAGGLVAQLERSGATLAVAESCTGGLIARRITEIPGVSPSFLGGIVAYSADVKVQVLGVPRTLIESHGVVSGEVAAAMAEAARSKYGADLALGVTGVAGPTGGTPETPVGCVYLGLATAESTWSRRLDIGPEQPRDVIQSRATNTALNWARVHLLSRDATP
ncbi:MAG TPA: competence/damage-inducible protein A [Isosphaeraceae bacterium]|jgi:nicotinamide-nucleotide amidase|nr:competence/damage-inducible protein A [Isosphaeraceae bacterium]